MNSEKKIKVLIVDDSAVVRQSLSTILQSDPCIEVMGTAADPIIAAKKIQYEVPDVITLDIEMPRMDGLTFLQKIMSQHPIPVVIISSLTARGTETAMKALQYGASEIIAKPAMNASQFFNEAKIMICDAVKAASQAKLSRLKTIQISDYVVPPKYSADVMLERGNLKSHIIDTDKIIVLGASTGGTEAIRYLLRELPARTPGIAIVQHMPEGFTKSFADGLNRTSAMEVIEASDGDRIYQGRVLIAPGNKHLMLKRTGKEYSVEVKDGPLVNRHRPAVDVLFRSAARYAGKNALGILLTGMGADGAKGLLELKETGSYTVAQDQNSCVVFGMPKEAIQLGAAEKVLGLSEIAPFIVERFRI